MSSPSKIIVLRSSDGESFEVEEAVALESQTIKHMIEDNCADNGIPLPNVTSKILAKVIEYCSKHVETRMEAQNNANNNHVINNGATLNNAPVAAPGIDEELKSWDADFVKIDQATLFDLILVRIDDLSRLSFLCAKLIF